MRKLNLHPAVLALACSAAMAASAQAPGGPPGPVGPALSRPALLAVAANRAVLLGAAQAGSRLVAVGERGIVLLSDDQGSHWRQAATPVSVTLTAVAFADALHGYAVGHGGVVLGTHDGGQSWQRLLDGYGIIALEKQAAQASQAPAALKSAQRLEADGPDKPLLDLQVQDGNRLLVVGAYGLALASSDGGKTWTSWRARLNNPRELHLYAIRRRGNTLVIAGEQGLLLRSDDAGGSFQQLATPYNGSFFTLELPADQAVLAAGLRGNVWRSDDGGLQWRQLASPVPASVTTSALLGDGQVLLGNQAGGLLLADRDGQALQPLRTGALPALNFVLPLAGGQLLTLSQQGAQRIALHSPAQGS